ncbi:MAG TPA: hypothetical protein VIJ92_03700 [Ginsengibacter sp.]
MLPSSEFDSVISSIVEEVQKLSALEQQELLIKMRLSKYLKDDKELVADFDKKKVKVPTLKQIDNWKHESRACK